MKFSKFIIAILITFSLIAIYGAKANAGDSSEAISTISRAISFMQNGPRGVIDMAIVYDPSNIMSKAQAVRVEEISTSPIGDGRVKLKGKKIPVQNLAKGKNYDVVFVTTGIVRKYKKLLESAQARGMITVSTNDTCLVDGGCLLVVDTSPDIEISINREIADKTKVRFA